MSDQQVGDYIKLALEHIQSALCENNAPCAPTTPAEQSNPPVSVPEARLVIQGATITALANHCGFDGTSRSYMPMMQYWRHTMKKDERAMAVIGLLHGVFSSQIEGALQSESECTDEMREQVEARLSAE